MTDRERISRKIAALFARAEDGASTPEEAATALRVAHRLMAEYDLTRDEAAMRAEQVGRQEHAFPLGQAEYIGMLAARIRRLAGCRIDGNAYRQDEVGTIEFLGLRVDVDYASWLLRTTVRALQTGRLAYMASPEYGRLIEGGARPDAIDRHFKLGFCLEMIDRMDALQSERPPPTTALALIKERVIADAFGVDVKDNIKRSQVAIRANLSNAFSSGAGEGAKVPLHHAVT